jgi:hypothetical protein
VGRVDEVAGHIGQVESAPTHCSTDHTQWNSV